MSWRRHLTTGVAVAVLTAAVGMACAWLAMALRRPALPDVRPVEYGDVPFVMALQQPSTTRVWLPPEVSR